MRLDAIVVGARCAGAATAMLLARAGARVVLVDRGVYGSDTLSTHALMRGAVLQLHRWGLLPAIVAAGTPPVRTTTFSYTDQDVTIAIEPRFGVTALYAPRRALLDRVLVDAAAEAGVDVRHGVRVDDVLRDGRGRVRGITLAERGALRRIEADVVIGADGLYSTIARRVGASTVVESRYATGVLYGYWQDLPTDGYYWRFQKDASTGVIPTNDGAVCIFVALPSRRFGDEIHGKPLAAYRALLARAAPRLAARVHEARLVDAVRGFAGHRGFLKRSSGPGWALVGDAGYFKDPLTAHGITDALRDAELLARAILRGTADAMEKYEATRYDLSRRMLDVTDEIASHTWTDDGLQTLHRDLSAEMSREVRVLAGLEPVASVSPAVSGLGAV